MPGRMSMQGMPVVTRGEPSALAPLFGPVARRRRAQRDLGSESLDECDALIGIETDLVRQAVAERPDDQVRCPGVLEAMRLGILRQIAGAVARRYGDALVAVVQHPLPGHDD